MVSWHEVRRCAVYLLRTKPRHFFNGIAVILEMLGKPQRHKVSGLITKFTYIGFVKVVIVNMGI